MNFLFPCYFEKIWLLWLVCLKYYYFLCLYELLFCIIWIWIFMPQWKKITLWIMLGSIPHQKFCFYHLPTQGRAGIKLGDAWYVSNVSIIFYCSMLLYYPFWMFMGFILHIYIIFGTNLLTGGPTHIAVFFAYFSISKKRNIKRSPNGMKPSGAWFLERMWSRGLGVQVK